MKTSTDMMGNGPERFSLLIRHFLKCLHHSLKFPYSQYSFGAAQRPPKAFRSISQHVLAYCTWRPMLYIFVCLCLFKLKIKDAAENFKNHQRFFLYLCSIQQIHFSPNSDWCDHRVHGVMALSAFLYFAQ